MCQALSSALHVLIHLMFKIIHSDKYYYYSLFVLDGTKEQGLSCSSKWVVELNFEPRQLFPETSILTTEAVL